MESTLLIAIIAFVVGSVLASLITWLVLKIRTPNEENLGYQLESAKSELNQKSDEVVKLDNINQALKIDKATLETTLNEKVDAITRHLENEHELKEDLKSAQNELTDLKEKRSALVTQIAKQEENFAEQKQQMLAAHEEFKTQFESLAAKALQQNNESFLNTANEVLKNYQQKASVDLEQRQENIKQLVKPVEEQLGKVTEYVTQVDKERAGAYKALLETVDQMKSSQGNLETSTNKLVNVLSNAKSRGQWGEIQLRRVVEIAGMTSYCDFSEQVHQTGNSGSSVYGGSGSTSQSGFSSRTGAGIRGSGGGSGDRYGKAVRPDLVVNLPGERLIVVDAKAPMDAYWQGHESDTDSERDQYFASHAKALRSHVGGLAAKKYQDSFKHSPEFVVLFLPNEAVYSTALEYDRGLIDAAASDNVIIATPTTLIALLKAVAYGWRQEKIADEVRKFTDLGREFYARLAKVTEHISKVGSSLDKTVDNYNSMIGSIERRLVPTARKFHDSSLVGDNKALLEEPTTVDRNARELAELTDLEGESSIGEQQITEGKSVLKAEPTLEDQTMLDGDLPPNEQQESEVNSTSVGEPELGEQQISEVEPTLEEQPSTSENSDEDVELELRDDLGELVDDFEDEFGKLRIAEKASGGGVDG